MTAICRRPCRSIDGRRRVSARVRPEPRRNGGATDRSLELSDLSTTLLTVSLSIIVFITYVSFALDSGLFPNVSFLGYTPLVVFISLAYAVTLAPYAVLTSYVLRAATATKLTPEEGPFVLDPERETAYDAQDRGR